jgi:hypothetical protein
MKKKICWENRQIKTLTDLQKIAILKIQLTVFKDYNFFGNHEN